MGKTQTESLPYWPSGTDVNAAMPRFMILSASLSYVCHMQCFSGPIIGPWSLSENNVLELANQSTRYIVNKLNPMISRTNLYMFFTIQLCMYFMEGQERKIHWATMIKCSTMLLAGLIYWITCRMLVVLKWMKKCSQVELLRKEILHSPTRVEPITFQNTFGRSNHWVMVCRTHGEQDRKLGSNVWHMSCHICKAE